METIFPVGGVAGGLDVVPKAHSPQYFSISAILPSEQRITLQRNLSTDTVAALVACIAGQAGLDDRALYAMHGSSYLNGQLTLQQCNLQECSMLRVLSRDALPGGTDYSSTHQGKLEDAMSQVVSELLSAKPSDPMSFMARRFTALSSEATAEELVSVAQCPTHS